MEAHPELSDVTVQTQATRLSDNVALFQALGGGLWNRQPVAAP
ncbi:MAG TPA: hypothetical protein VF472_02765 [Burkholderiaceae bacterium]